MRPAVFLDRDGTIIEDGHYLRDPEGVRLLPGAVEGLRRMREKGFLLFVVSNQSGVSRGIIDDASFRAVHNRVCDLLLAGGVEISEYAYCFHLPDDHCRCRKPAKGLVPAKFNGVQLDWAKSYTVGDKPCDVELAVEIGARGFLVLTGKGRKSLAELEGSTTSVPYVVCPSLLEVADALPENVTEQTCL